MQETAVAIPVADMDRAKAFYSERAGFTSMSIIAPARTSGLSSSPRRDRLARLH
jgi:predicted enzyme related to lactoylglutathione lyase